MIEKKEWSVMDYDYTKTYPDIDYSEVKTEPGLVLSMREIYNRYAAAGVDLLNGQLVPDPDDDSEMQDFDPDDNVDILHQIHAQRRAAKMAPSRDMQESMHSASANGEKAKPSDHPDEPKVAKQSVADEGEPG